MAIEIREFSTMPQLAADGWDPGACDIASYDTPRAKALFDAPGALPWDDEYMLVQHRETGKWALFGLMITGHKYAMEV